MSGILRAVASGHAATTLDEGVAADASSQWQSADLDPALAITPLRLRFQMWYAADSMSVWINRMQLVSEIANAYG